MVQLVEDLLLEIQEDRYEFANLKVTTKLFRIFNLF